MSQRASGFRRAPSGPARRRQPARPADLARLATGLAGLAGLTMIPACPEPAPGPCAGEGALGIVARPNRLDTDPIGDGSAVPVFPPPQGGVFTELDVNVAGVRAEDLQTLRVRIDDKGGQTLAVQQYNGAGLPLVCAEDDTLLVIGLPVGFSFMTELPALDGLEATLHLGIDTAARTLDLEWDVVLIVTS